MWNPSEASSANCSFQSAPTFVNDIDKRMNSFFHDFAARNKNLMNVLLKWNSKNSVKLEEFSKFCQNMLDQNKMKTTKKHLTSKNVNFEGKYWVNGVIWFEKKKYQKFEKRV